MKNSSTQFFGYYLLKGTISSCSTNSKLSSETERSPLICQSITSTCSVVYFQAFISIRGKSLSLSSLLQYKLLLLLPRTSNTSTELSLFGKSCLVQKNTAYSTMTLFAASVFMCFYPSLTDKQIFLQRQLNKDITVEVQVIGKIGGSSSNIYNQWKLSYYNHCNAW